MDVDYDVDYDDMSSYMGACKRFFRNTIFPTFSGFPCVFLSVQYEMKFTFISSESLFSHLDLCIVNAKIILICE